MTNQNKPEAVEPSEKHVAYRMWLDTFEPKLSTERERVLSKSAFMCGWDASLIAKPEAVEVEPVDFDNWHIANAKYMEPSDIVPWCKEAFVAGQSSSAARIAALESELSALRKDAERYRWLRNESCANYDELKMRLVVSVVAPNYEGDGFTTLIVAEGAMDQVVDTYMEVSRNAAS